jgi:hypothetical protein
MKLRLLTMLSVVLFCELSLAQLEGSKTKPFIKPDSTKSEFGEKIGMTSQPLTAEEAIAKFKASKAASSAVLVKAKVEKVCQKKGCWMTVVAKPKEMRIIFKDYGFFVPFTLSGKQVLAEGKVTEKQLTLEETKHFAEDEGLDPATVTEAAKDYQFVASGIKVLN